MKRRWKSFNLGPLKPEGMDETFKLKEVDKII